MRSNESRMTLEYCAPARGGRSNLVEYTHAFYYQLNNYPLFYKYRDREYM